MITRFYKNCLLLLLICTSTITLNSQNPDCEYYLPMWSPYNTKTPVLECFPLQTYLKGLGQDSYPNICSNPPNFSIDNPHGFFFYEVNDFMQIEFTRYYGFPFQIMIYGPIDKCIVDPNTFFANNCPFFFGSSDYIPDNLTLPLPSRGGLYFIMLDGLWGSTPDIDLSVIKYDELQKGLSPGPITGGTPGSGLKFSVLSSYYRGTSDKIIDPNFFNILNECGILCCCGGGDICDITQPIEIISITHPDSWDVSYSKNSYLEQFDFTIENITEPGDLCIQFMYDTCVEELCIPIRIIEDTLYKCPNTQVKYQGKTFSEPGDYIFNLGGETYRIFKLTVINSPAGNRSFEQITLCDGQVYIAPNGTVLTQEKTYPFVIQSGEPCPDTLFLDLKFLRLDIDIDISNEITCEIDSTIVTINILPSVTEDSIRIVVTDSDGQSIYSGSPSPFAIREPGIYTLKVYVSIDSILCEYDYTFSVQENMDFTPDFTWVQLDTIICQDNPALLYYSGTDKLIHVIDSDGQIIEINDNRYITPNLFETTCLDLVFQHPSGKCTFTKTICIEVHNADTTQLGIIHLCQEDSLNIAGNAYSISGKYEVQTKSAKGCDSLIFFELQFRQNDTIEIKEAICPGSSIELHGIVYSQPGLYTIQLSDHNECDSIILLNIELIPSDTLYRKVLHCPDESYKIRDNLIVAQLPFQFQYDSIPDIGCRIIIIESHENYQFIQFGADIGHTCPNASDGFIRIFGHVPSDSTIKFDWNPKISDNNLAEQLSSGTYEVTITDSNGCKQHLSFRIEEKSIPAYILQSIPETCPEFRDGQIIVQGEEIVSILVNGVPTLFHVRDLTPGEYEVTIQFSNGCNISEFIVIEKGINLDYTLPDTLFTNSRDREKWLSVPIVWSDLELLEQVIWQSVLPLNCTDCPYPNIQVLNSGVLSITAKSQTGCTRSDRMILYMESGFQHFIPDAFTPNGDGTNDQWELMGKIDNISALRIQIFNRWGGKILDNHLSAPFNVLWDGKCNQDTCPADAYIYLIEWIDEEGINRNYFGTVSLLR